VPVIECDVAAARATLEEAGVEVEPGNTDHERWRAHREDATAVAYDGKLVVQGTDPGAIERLLRGAGVTDATVERAHVYFDGAARGNPGPAAVGWAVVSADGVASEGGERIGRATNNRAEYEALVRALEAAVELGFRRVDVRGDSELVVRQVRGEYETRDPTLRERRVTARELLERFDDWSMEHVPRSVNERADRLASEALDES
jgi:ribonuclease HI